MNFFSKLTDQASFLFGKPQSFIAAAFLTAIWLIAGPLFGWSDAWQLVANTVTNVATFLMVFVLQNSQNRESAALQAKMDELLRFATPRADLQGIEDLTQEEIVHIKERRRTR